MTHYISRAAQWLKQELRVSWTGAWNRLKEVLSNRERNCRVCLILSSLSSLEPDLREHRETLMMGNALCDVALML